MAHHVFLRTPRLYLRRFTIGDVPLLVELDSDPEVMRYISHGEPTPRDRIEHEILPRWLAYYEAGDHVGFWAAHEQTTDAFIGWFHLRPDQYAPEEMELGYRLRRAAWGRGYATEGGRALIAHALIAHAFTEGDVAVISATTLVGNTASQRVMAKCGLRFAHAFVYPADLLPGWTAAERRAVKYRLHRHEWLASGEPSAVTGLP